MEMRRQLRLGESVHLRSTGRLVLLVDGFDFWLPSLFDRMAQNMQIFSEMWLESLEITWNGNTQDDACVRAQVSAMMDLAGGVFVDQSGFYDPV